MCRAPASCDCRQCSDALADRLFCMVVLCAFVAYMWPGIVAEIILANACLCAGLIGMAHLVAFIQDQTEMREQAKQDLYWTARRESWDARDSQLEATFRAEQAAAALALLEEEEAQKAALFEAFQKNEVCAREYCRILARRLSFPPRQSPERDQPHPAVRSAYTDQREFALAW